MANKGETKTQKSLSAPTIRHLKRKTKVFTFKSRPGPHSKETSVPLGFAVRDLLEVSNNLKETKKILTEGSVKVNGTIRKDGRFPVGLFDVVEITPVKKKYRVLLDKKGRIILTEIDFKGETYKVSKIVNKKTGKNSKIKITTNDGFTFELGKEKATIGDSVKIVFPEIKMGAVYHMDKDGVAFITGGTHVGEITTVEGITEGTLQRKKLVSLSNKDSKFQTVTNNVYVIGKGKAEIEALQK